MVNITSLLINLISANHILHNQNVVDAYGHISIRSPTNPEHFIMSGNRAPALVASPSDLVTYYVENASSVDSNAPKGYIERYLHSEMYKRFSNVSCVIHAHAPDVLPYAISGVPFRPVFHLPGFLGEEVPVWDIETVYNDTDAHDLLVRNERDGASLASQFAAPSSSNDTKTPDRRVVLMKKHGFTTWGDSIEKAVFRAVFSVTNSKVSTDSILLRNAFAGQVGQGITTNAWVGDGSVFANALEPLTSEQAAAAQASNDGTIDRPWGLWVAEVEANSLYVNNGTDGTLPDGYSSG